MYFNFGHFYQRPAISFLYNTTIYLSSATVPTPDLDMARTVSYEFGYEQTVLDEFLVNLLAYYKDVSGEPLSTSYISYAGDFTLARYNADAYSDTRGVEVRLERPVGRFVTFTAMYEYMLKSTGQSGLARVYENRWEAAQNGELRSANVTVTDPVPRANVNLSLHTPQDFGPDFLGAHWLGGWLANFLFEWQDGGRILMNPGEPDVKQWIYADVVDWWNIDFRGSKTFDTPYGDLEFVITIKNLTDNKFLSTANMTQSQYNDYKASLMTPDKYWPDGTRGTDKWGEYDKGYLKTGWWTAPIFLNPRRIILGLRLNL
jgi:hypothetical protein